MRIEVGYVNANMFDLYYNYKIKTLVEYSILLSKILGIDKNKLFTSKKKTEEVLTKIVTNYFERLDYNHKNDQKLIRCFINNKEIAKYHLDSELYSVINYFTNTNKAFEIKAYEKEIILASVIINIANKLDISTSPYKENKNNYKTILISYIEKYRQIEYIHIIDNGKKKTDLLLELIKTNVRKERKIFDGLSSDISFNKYICVSENEYISQYNYSVPNINKFDKQAINYVYNKHEFDDEFASISADLITVSFMKFLSVRMPYNNIYLPLKKDFFENDNNFKKIAGNFKSKYLQKHLRILINYQEFNDKIYNKLKNNHITYYLYCNKNSLVGNNFKNPKATNYLISKDFNLKYQEIIAEEISDNIVILIEDYQGIFTDKEIIKNGGIENE